MVGLIALVALWAALAILAVGARSVARPWRIGIGGIVVAYGAVMWYVLATSYLANRNDLGDFPARQAEAAARMRMVLKDNPDSLAHDSLVVAARTLEKRLADAGAAFGPRTWRVVWRAHVVPSFDAQFVARNLRTLVGVPPLLAYARARYNAQMRDLIACRDSTAPAFPFVVSATASFMDNMINESQTASRTALMLCDTLSLAYDDPADPRSSARRLAMLADRTIAMHAKIDEVFQIACGAFEQSLSLRVVRAYQVAEQPDTAWTPYSPLFLDMDQVFIGYNQVNCFDVRWMGDPPRPTIGAPDAICRLDCETTGPWPAGQGRWVDSTTGASGPTYVVGLATFRRYAASAQLAKWPGQPDLRLAGATGTLEDLYLSGVPASTVSESELRPTSRPRAVR